MNTQWHEIAEALPELEAIAEGGGGGGEDATMEDTTTATNNSSSYYDESTRRTAAALASRVFFHLEEPKQALRLALESGDVYFNVLHPNTNNNNSNDDDGPYVEQLVNAAIGEYIQRKQKEFDGGEEEEDEDAHDAGGRTSVAGTKKKPSRGIQKGGVKKVVNVIDEEGEEELDMTKLQKVVQLMFQRCYMDGSYGHALGVAFEARECDKVQEILDKLTSTTTTITASSTTTTTVSITSSPAHPGGCVSRCSSSGK